MTREPEREALPLRMNAYYYSFTPTGYLPVDRILSAVACAGKGCHHTDEWTQYPEEGDSYIDRIQAAANEAANEARARLGKGEVGSKLSHRDLELQARLAFEAECADSLVDLSPATKISANHDMPYENGETTVRWWGFRSGYDCGYQAALAHAQQWQPIETAPKDGTWVRLKGGAITYCWDGDNEPPEVVAQYTHYINGTTKTEGWWQFAWYDGGYYGKYEAPTHWRPLPDAPDAKDGGPK